MCCTCCILLQDSYKATKQKMEAKQDGEALFQVKSPSKNEAFPLRLSLDCTVGEVHARLSKEDHFGRPAEAEQTVRARMYRNGCHAHCVHLQHAHAHSLTRHAYTHVQLIYAGKVLRDRSMKLREIVGKVRTRECAHAVFAATAEAGLPGSPQTV